MINDELTTDSDDVPHEPDRIPSVSDVASLEKSYVVKRIKEQNGTVYYQPAAKSSGNHNRGFSDSIGEILSIWWIKKNYRLSQRIVSPGSKSVANYRVTFSKNAKFHNKSKVFGEFCFDFCQR